jgi:large-conductance mechanosensitive channel
MQNLFYINIIITLSMETTFAHFLVENKVVTMVIASILSERIHDITTSIFEHIIMPLFSFDLNKKQKY